MAKKQTAMTYIPLYFTMEATLARLSDEQAGRLLRATLHYAATGEIPSFPGNSPEFFMWPQMQDFVDRHFEAYREKCETNRENGKKAIQSNQGNNREQGKDADRQKAAQKEVAENPLDWRDLSKDRLH